jgi:transcription elongation factor GreA
MNYLSQKEIDRLQGDLDERNRFRSEISDRIGRARELGDLKENGDYHAAREEQGFNEAKIRELEGKLSSAVLIGDQEVPDGVVYFGMTVKLKNLKSGNEDLYKLVGDATGSFDLDYTEVTQNSALGEALVKSRVGERIDVDLPRGRTEFEIIEIIG